MLLILTNSQDATTDYLVSRLLADGVSYLRFDTDKSLSKIQLGYMEGKPVLQVDRTLFQPSCFTNVWYRRPERLRHLMLDDSPEGIFIYGEWAEALEGFFGHISKTKWMNHPACNVGASHKLEQLTTARKLGFMVPETLVTQDADELRAFYAKHNGRLVVKPMASGHVKRSDGQLDSLVYTNQVDGCQLEHLDDLPWTPTLFQQYIDKKCDVRITVVDDRVHAVALMACESDGSQRCDIRRNNMDDVEYREMILPAEVAKKIEMVMSYYGLRFAAIDMAIGKDGNWYFFEVNPNGQWAWLDLVGGMDIASSFIKVFRG